MPDKTKGGPGEFDKHIGARVKMFRGSRNVSQNELAGRLGITFQQLQKYEMGKNRISATKLFEISEYLEVNVTDFYEGYQGAGSEKSRVMDDVVGDADTAKLFHYWREIKDEKLRKNLLTLLKTYVREDNTED